ncbi:NADH-quinone oxidoreductase subunit D [bacterium]|nr:NADH-quinone oxidoreductase subunit D [bacterium]
MKNSSVKINIGPQHPSTHGVLRLIAELDGEEILSIEPVVGYLHRGIEKMAESRSYLQYLPIVDRVDYLGGFFTSYAYCDAVEHLLNLEVPKRADYIRMLCMELNRIASHQLWLGTFMLDLGASSPLFYCFRDREEILSLFEELTGQRMMYNYFTFGGVRFDVTNEWLSKVSDFVSRMPKAINDYEKIITLNPIFTQRTVEKGILSPAIALQYSVTGPNLRASAVELDFRKNMPYAAYNDVDFVIAESNRCDSYGRYLVRIQEMKTSLDIIKQAVLYLKNDSSDYTLNINPVNIKVPEGEYTSYVESSRGLLSCYIKSDGSGKPYRVKWRTGSYYAVQVLPEIVKGLYYNDLIAIFGSLDVIMPEVDR